MPVQFNCPSCNKTIKAPDTLAGKMAKCPYCSSISKVPEGVVDAEIMPNTPVAPPPNPGMPPLPSQEEGDRRPCPMCGEMILASAVKCRFCNEIFDETLRKSEQKKGGPLDQDLTTGDWIVALLCSGIGCIVGIVWTIQGKPKGSKMLGISFAMVIFWNILRFVIGSAIQK